MKLELPSLPPAAQDLCKQLNAPPVIPPRPGCGVDTRFVHEIPGSCTDYPFHRCLCFQPIANGTGVGYTSADRPVPLLVIAFLRHLPREAIGDIVKSCVPGF